MRVVVLVSSTTRTAPSSSLSPSPPTHLAPTVCVSKMPPVVAPQQNDRVVLIPLGLQRREHTADLRVGERCCREVPSSLQSAEFVADRMTEAEPLLLKLRPWDGGGKGRGVVEMDENDINTTEPLLNNRPGIGHRASGIASGVD